MIQEQLTIDTLNQLESNIAILFFQKHINDLKEEQIKGINMTNPEISAIFIQNKTDLLSREQIGQIFNLDTHKINSILKQTNPKLKFKSYLRLKKKFEYIPEPIFNSVINFKSIDDIIEILEENLQDQINPENVIKIDITKLKKLVPEELMVKLTKSRADFFKDEQIHLLNLKNLEITIIILDKKLQDKLLKDQVQDIALEKLNEIQLKILFVSKFNDFSNNQLNSKEVLNILPKIPDKDIISLLEKRVGDLGREQIQNINVGNVKIASILVIERSKDISKTQIQKMDLFLKSPLQKEIWNKSPNLSGLYYLRINHRYSDMSDDQLNNCLNFNYIDNIKEILFEQIETRILKKNIEKILIDQLYQNINYNMFASFFNSFYSKFSNSQIQTLDTNDSNIANLIIQNNLFSNLNDAQQIQFNKNVLYQCSDSILVSFVNNPWKNLNDCLVSGLLLYRYYSNDIKNDSLIKFKEDLFNQKKYDDIFFAKLIFIAQKNFSSKGIMFANISKNFFEDFSEMKSLKKLGKKESIQIDYKYFSITPEDMTFFFWKVFQNLNIDDVDRLLHKNPFSNFSSEYKNKLDNIRIIKILNNEGKFQKFLHVSEPEDGVFSLFN